MRELTGVVELAVTEEHAVRCADINADRNRGIKEYGRRHLGPSPLELALLEGFPGWRVLVEDYGELLFYPSTAAWSEYAGVLQRELLVSLRWQGWAPDALPMRELGTVRCDFGRGTVEMVERKLLRREG